MSRSSRLNSKERGSHSARLRWSGVNRSKELCQLTPNRLYYEYFVQVFFAHELDSPMKSAPDC